MGFEQFFYRDLLYYPVAWVQAGNVKKYQIFLESTQFQSRQDTARLQTQRLQSLFEHARNAVPFFGGYSFWGHNLLGTLPLAVVGSW